MERSTTVGMKQKVSSIIIPTISGTSFHGLSIMVTGNGERGNSGGNKFCDRRHHVVGNEGKHSVMYVGHIALQQPYLICISGGEC
jgi:hypothetical protein